MAEKVYTINLRKATLKTPRWEKSKKSIKIIRNFLKRHMKGDEVRIGQSITEKVWEGGSQQIPPKIRIKAVETEEDEKKIIKAELLGVIFPEELKEEKKEKKKEEKAKEEVKPEEKPKEEEIKKEPSKEKKK